MQSEGPYSTGDSVGLVFKDSREVESFDSERDKLNACRLANAAFAAGRQAERERCADICEQNATCEGIAQKIKAHILGGQDGE